MKKEIRTAVFDEELKIEAYRFQGFARSFPRHFHEYYVIGLIEAGRRSLSCRDAGYEAGPGDMLLFNPGDSHACIQREGEDLDYRGLNIPGEVMSELTGGTELPGFSRTVVRDEEAAGCFRSLHELIMAGSREFCKEESLLALVSLLRERYGRSCDSPAAVCGGEVERACGFMEAHYMERIGLEDICREAALSKSALLRAFTEAKGVTPYSYLENVRIGRAKLLLEQGVSPAEAAQRTGFSDQSHFTNYFSRFIGLPPGAYQRIFQDREE